MKHHCSFLLLLAAQAATGQLVLPSEHPALQGLPAQNGAVRAVVFGDFGSPRQLCVDHGDQKRLADAMFAERPYHLGLTVGDNFYKSGVKKPDDKHWKCSWDDQYSRFSIPFFATLGNHDWRGKPEVQVARGGKGGFWMPANYYAFQAGPIRFIALDTDEDTTESGPLNMPVNKPWSTAQLTWLKARLAEGGAPWTVVYGHHPVFTSGEHGNDARPKYFREHLLPALRQAKLDVFIAGHDHHMEYLESDGMQHFVSGGGGRDLREPNHPLPAGVESKFKSKSFGYLVIDADANKLTVTVKTLRPDGSVKSEPARTLTK